MIKGPKCDYDKRNISRGHLWHRYSVAANQVMVATVKLSKSCLELNHRFSSSIISSNTLSRISDMNHKLWNINWERYILHMQVLH